MSKFLDMGFAPTVTACSQDPQVDGYHGMLSGLPYQIHPQATPSTWSALTEAIATKKVAVTAWSPPVVDPADAIAARRTARDRLLTACDWTQLADSLYGQPDVKASWAAYRQQLRNLDMSGTDWPTAPASDEVRA